MAKRQLARAEDNTASVYDQYFLDYPLSELRPRYRLSQGLAMLHPYTGDKKVLCVGVGNMAEARALQEAGFDPVLCDISPLAVRTAKEQGFEAVICDLLADDIPGPFELIFCLEVLEHVSNPLLALQNLKGALAPGGRLVLSLPNEFHLYRRLRILLGRPGCFGHDYHHLRLFNVSMAKRLILDAGLKIKGVSYAPLMPLTWRYVLPFGELMMKLRPEMFALSSIWLVTP